MSVDFGDISNIDNTEDDLTLDNSDFDDMMNNTTRESISLDNVDLTNNSLDLSEIDNVDSTNNSLDLSDMDDDINLTNDTTKESIELSFGGGGKKRRTRKNKKKNNQKNQKTRKARKMRKTIRQKRRNGKIRRSSRKIRRSSRKINIRGGGDVDSLFDADFNANLAIDKKAIGGSKQSGGRNVGFNCFDPNLSIYNTRSLQLFPYKP